MYRKPYFPAFIMLLAAAAVMAQIPHAPQLASPAHGAAVAHVSPTLIWYDVSGAGTYCLQISTDSVFAAPVFSDSTITDTFRIVGPLITGRTYYWRVNATNPGHTGPWSDVGKFSVSLPTFIMPSPPSPRMVSSKRTATCDLLGRVVAGAAAPVRRSLTNGCYLRTNGGRTCRITVVH
jgi:hypothetical protein